MEEHAERWGVVGGGLLGLTLALRLAERGRRVTLIEAADRRCKSERTRLRIALLAAHDQP